MSIPGIDFELHNSLFLVAHFHNMIIGGVLFGFFAGLTYWFPKIFGYRLHEKIGKWAFWSWLVGFLLAFIPLYLLGLMGATRRLSVVEPEWQPLFIVAALGACVIALAIFLQLLQLVVSYMQREKLRDTTGDPWPGPPGGGRTLEWSTSSPPPVYNFKEIPWAAGRDAWWLIKKGEVGISGSAEGRVGNQLGGDMSAGPMHIELPKNSPLGLYIAVCAGIVGFALIWHIWWLIPVGLILGFALLIYRGFDEHTEQTITV
jgi:cytochrome o ubiquinol oxidase subunit I